MPGVSMALLSRARGSDFLRLFFALCCIYQLLRNFPWFPILSSYLLLCRDRCERIGKGSITTLLNTKYHDQHEMENINHIALSRRLPMPFF